MMLFYILNYNALAIKTRWSGRIKSAHNCNCKTIVRASRGKASCVVKESRKRVCFHVIKTTISRKVTLLLLR